MGHKHFLTMLTYCWTILVKLQKADMHNNDVAPTSSSSATNSQQN
jgi:hypothetical protein